MTPKQDTNINKMPLKSISVASHYNQIFACDATTGLKLTTCAAMKEPNQRKKGFFVGAAFLIMLSRDAVTRKQGTFCWKT